MDRQKKIIRTSIIGIIANVLLSGFKAVVGLLANSVPVVLDAVNNLTDALSSIITIIGTKIAGKQPDKKHPLGHGRVEYLSAMIIAVIIMYAGVTALIESIKKIISPVTPDYSVVTLIVITVAVFVKIILGTHVKKVGKEVNSASLIGSGTDALFDAVISTTTLIAAIIFLTTDVSLESYLGVLISLVIIKAGLDMIRETISEILGKRIEAELARNVKAAMCTFPEVSGAYDLVIHNYGPDILIGSAHIEVPENLTALELDNLERNIAKKVYQETGVTMAGISIYAINTSDEESVEIEKKIKELAYSHEGVLEIHGFYLDKEEKTVRFDMIIDYDIKDRKSIYDHIVNDLKNDYPQYDFQVILDVDISE